MDWASNQSPLQTNAKSVTVSGNIGNIFLTDSGSTGVAAPVAFNSSGLTGTTQLAISLTGPGASINVGLLPATINKISILAEITGGTISFAGNGITTGPLGSVILAANEIDFPTNSSFKIDASSTQSLFGGGTINIATNKVNGSALVALGNQTGQLSLIAQGISDGTNMGAAGSITLTTASTSSVSIGIGGIDVSYNGVTNGNGGTISLTTGSLNPGSALSLSANGVGTGTGGSITVNLTSANTALTIGNNPGQLSFSALNGAAGSTATTGGSVTVNTTGSLTVDPTAIAVNNQSQANATNVSGGTINLTGSSVASLSGGTLTLMSDGVGTGNGGKILVTEILATGGQVTLGQGQSFYFEAKSTGVSGNGGQVTFSTQDDLKLTTDASGNVIGAALSADIGPAGTSGNGTGGALSLTGKSISNANNASTTALVFNAMGIGTGSGGTVKVAQLDSTQSIDIGNGAGQFAFDVANGATGTLGGRVFATIANNATFNGIGQIVIDPAAIVETSVSKTNANVSGGTISLQAPAIIQAANVSTKTALVLNANGAGKASGGHLTIDVTNANAAPIIGTKTGQIELLAAAGSGGGSGGSVSVISGGNLTVNATGLSVKASGSSGNGGIIGLGAAGTNDVDNSTGNLLVVGSLAANAAGTGNGGSIGLNSNSASVFNEGLASKNTNGVTGSLSASGPNGGITLGTSGSGGYHYHPLYYSCCKHHNYLRRRRFR